MRRIFYFSKHHGAASGGVRTSYRHVEVLCRHGFDASILLLPSKTQADFESTAPVLPFESRMSFAMTDILVIPEGWAWLIRPFGDSQLRTAVFCQNSFYMFDGLGRAPSYEALGIDRVFCSSDFIAKALHDHLGSETVPVVPYSIDLTLYKPGKKKAQIAYMPRKMPAEACYIRAAFQRRYPEYDDIPWIKIDNMNETEVARALGESTVFLSLSRLEGLGLPPLEAMASNCLVAGFLGDAGWEFATSDNGFWCNGEDWHGATDALANAMKSLGTESGTGLIDAGRQTVANYSVERMERALIQFWTEEARLP